MRRLRRIVVIVAVTLAPLFIGAEWVAPVATSIETARKPPRYANLVPVDLQDLTISQAPGRKLSYFGYDFEIPWNDLDETKTEVHGRMVVLSFRSGLKMMVGASPAKLWVNGLASNWHVSQARLQASFGAETMHSDYNFLKMLYAFTPEQMHRWALSPRIHYREFTLLILKSAALLPPAEKGFFNVHNQGYRGFQQGNPNDTPMVFVSLYSNDGEIEFTIYRTGHQNVALSQAEINRVLQSVHKSANGESVVSTAAAR